MNDNRALTLLDDFLSDAPSPESVLWMQAGLKSWLAPGCEIALTRYLHLGTASKCRLALRDRLLNRAAAHLTGSSWNRASKLADAVVAFEARRWPTWKTLAAPPQNASPVDAVLWHAMRLGAPLPETARHLFNLLE